MNPVFLFPAARLLLVLMVTATLVTSTLLSTTIQFPLNALPVVSASEDTSIKHVIFIVLENQNYDSVYGSSSAPYLTRIANEYSLLTNYHAVTHPSLPNYIAMVAGDYFQVSDDDLPLKHSSISDNKIVTSLMDQTNVSWTAYMESMPSPCATSPSGLYAVKHNPFVYFHSVTDDVLYCRSHVVNFSKLTSDLANNSLPSFAFVVPNLDHDGHDTSLSSTDKWVSMFLPQLLTSPSFSNSVIFITFDEDESEKNSSNHIYTAIVGPDTIVKQAYKSATKYDHYSLLATIEKIFDLGTLKRNDASSSTMDDVFQIAISGSGRNSVDFSFAVAGDWGCTVNTDATVDAISKKRPDLVLALGDFSYQETGDCWLKKIAPIDNKTRIVIGNHDSTPALLAQYLGHFGLSQQYYSFDYKNVHFLALATELLDSQQQLDFVKQDLAQASSDPGIQWIVVFFHKLMYSSPNGLPTEPQLATTYHPLFEKYHVDFVLQGHQHAYERSFPIKYNNADPTQPIATSTNQSQYENPDGLVYATVGTGGAFALNYSAKAPFVAVQYVGFGFLLVNITNDNTLVGTFYHSEGAPVESFSITKRPGPPSPEQGPNLVISANTLDGEKKSLFNNTSTQSTSILLSFASNTISTEGQVFECSLDGGEYFRCSSSVSYNALNLGQHIFKVRMVTLNAALSLPTIFVWNVQETSETPSLKNYTLTAGATTSNLQYSIIGGNLTNLNVDSKRNALVASIKPLSSSGLLTIRLPRDVIRATGSDGKDIEFTVLIDGKRAEFEEGTPTSSDRVLVINYDGNSREIYIVGTAVIPEFSEAFVWIGAGLGLVFVIMVRHRRLLNMRDFFYRSV